MTVLDKIKDVLEESQIDYTVFMCDACREIDGRTECVSLVPNDEHECQDLPEPTPINCLYGKPNDFDWKELK
jgi:hypothetical protein